MYVKVTIEGEQDSGKRTLMDTLCRLLDANRVPYERHHTNGREDIAIDTSAGVQHLRAYPLEPNPFEPQQCVDAEGRFKSPVGEEAAPHVE